ncbi:hypothetical protein B0T10DRAFT_498819 [Thelonectria olida]|uniref:Secreted protein n=1 Tax=Thelonectria olida TaxID=1576542 RepID=A0A9P9ALB9_9HYPO|nr:hypothetical protein B0T10DRAFT_498819 [Thelonectria olida]
MQGRQTRYFFGTRITNLHAILRLFLTVHLSPLCTVHADETLNLHPEQPTEGHRSGAYHDIVFHFKQALIQHSTTWPSNRSSVLSPPRTPIPTLPAITPTATVSHVPRSGRAGSLAMAAGSGIPPGRDRARSLCARVGGIFRPCTTLSSLGVETSSWLLMSCFCGVTVVLKKTRDPDFRCSSLASVPPFEFVLGSTDFCH